MTMHLLSLAVIFLTGLAATMIGTDGPQPLHVVPSVDYARYAGQWYEIARLPNVWQQACARDVTLRYIPRPNGTMALVTLCREASGRWCEARGAARRANDEGPNSSLQVRFTVSFLAFLPFAWSDYQIIAVADDYRYALVGTPDRQSLWVLSRTPQLDEATYQHLMTQAHEQGFAVSQMQRTPQSALSTPDRH
jgi:apolipoprotein D and lipocalin family protein